MPGDLTGLLPARARALGQLAFAINADGIHVLVDLNGHTLGARSQAVALGPAPLTVFDQVGPARGRPKTGERRSAGAETARIVEPFKYRPCAILEGVVMSGAVSDSTESLYARRGQGFAGSSGGVATHLAADKISLPPDLVAVSSTERVGAHLASG